MIRLSRIAGILMIVAGALVLLSWFLTQAIEPLQQLWPYLLDLPFPIQLGLVLAAIGIFVLMGSLIWERMEERESDRSLRDDD